MWCDTHGVHPVSVGLFLSGLLYNFQSFDSLLWNVQSWVVVEQIGNKGQIQFVDPIDNVLRCDETAAVQFGSLLQHYFGSLFEVALTHSLHCNTTASRSDLFQQMSVHLGVDNVALEICTSSGSSSTFQVEVDCKKIGSLLIFVLISHVKW